MKLLISILGVSAVGSTLFPLCLRSGQRVISVSILLIVLGLTFATWNIGRQRRRVWTECIGNGLLLGAVVGSLIFNTLISLFFAIAVGGFAKGFGVAIFLLGISLPLIVQYLKCLSNIRDDLDLLLKDRESSVSQASDFADPYENLQHKIKACKTALEILETPLPTVEKVLEHELFWLKLQEASLYWFTGFSLLSMQFVEDFQTLPMWLVLAVTIICASITRAGFELINRLSVSNATSSDQYQLEAIKDSYRSELVAEINHLNFELSQLKRS